MCSYNNINRSFFETLCGCLHLGIINKSAHERNLDWEASEAVDHSCEVLTGEKSGWNQNRSLLIVLHRFEDSSDGNFCFSKTYVRAYESVHRTEHFHVRLDIINCLRLIRRERVWKQLFHFLLPRGVRAEGVSYRNISLTVEINELLCHQERCCASFGASLLPLSSTHARQGRPVATGVWSERINLFCGPVATAIFKFKD